MASLARRPDGKWRARYRDDDGKEISRHFGRRVDAQRWLDEIRATQLAGTYVDPAMGRQTFQEFAETWRAAQPHRPTTRKNVAQHLNRYVYDTLGDRPLAAIRPSEVQAWATAVSSRLAPSTVRTVANTVKAVFAAAVRDRIIVFNPCDGLVLPQLPRRRVEPLTIDQVQAIYGAVPDQYRALIAVAVGTGLRSGELFGLQLRHIDFAARTLTVDQQVQQLAGSSVYVGPPKTPSSYRTVPLPQLVVDELTAHARRYPPDPDGFLFTTPNGGPIVRTSFNHAAWQPAAAAARLPKGVGMHALRHFYASALIRSGLSVRVVSERLGHSNAAMTLNVYAHLWPDDEDRTRQAIDRLFAAPTTPSPTPVVPPSPPYRTTQRAPYGERPYDYGPRSTRRDGLSR